MQAFADCQNLTTATLPASLPTLSRDVFKADRKLTSVSFYGDDGMRVIQPNAFCECTSLTDIALPDTVTEIGSRAFYRCKSLSSLHLPASIQKISVQAFYFCAFPELELPESLEVLEDSAFFKCVNLAWIRLPENVRYIGKWAFHGCNRLQYLEVRHDPEFIGEWIINRATTVRCYQGSKMDRYCRENGFQVEYL